MQVHLLVVSFVVYKLSKDFSSQKEISMEIIAHRINCVLCLKNVPTNYGAEIDIRSIGDRLILQHEAYSDGVDFKEWLSNYNHGTLILDIKEERLECRCLELIHKYNIKNYFFLDCSFPMIYKLSSEGEHNIAIRFSEFEGLDTVRAMAGKCNWVWVDTFTRNPLTKEIADEIHSLGYKICFVSPELQGQPELKEKYLSEVINEIDAICTDI